MIRIAELIHVVTAVVAAAGSSILLLASPSAPQSPTTAQKAVAETIPGTLVKFEMVPVTEGTVTIDGSTVNVGRFLIGRTEVTWDMYDVFALGLDATAGSGADATAQPSKTRAADAVARPSQPYGAPDYNWGHNGYPVISVTRNAAEQFCKWLSAKTGKHYRLPTEAEWVRAAELAAGSTSTPAAREPLTWHAGNSKGTTQPVGKRKADTLGLFDLFGNATEWVMTNDEQHVTRGGAFRDPLPSTGPAARVPYDLSWQERDPQLPKSTWWLSDAPFVGFRLALSEQSR